MMIVISSGRRHLRHHRVGNCLTLYRSRVSNLGLTPLSRALTLAPCAAAFKLQSGRKSLNGMDVPKPMELLLISSVSVVRRREGTGVAVAATGEECDIGGTLTPTRSLCL